MTVLKIVIDTNILMAIIGRSSPYRWIFDRLITGELALCVSNEIMFEYREVLERKTSLQVAENIINFIDIHPATKKTEINFNLIFDDPDDNKFVDCAISAKADLILSNDSHFRVLKKTDFPKVEVLTLSEFETRYK